VAIQKFLLNQCTGLPRCARNDGHIELISGSLEQTHRQERRPRCDLRPNSRRERRCVVVADLSAFTTTAYPSRVRLHARDFTCNAGDGCREHCRNRELARYRLGRSRG